MLHMSILVLGSTFSFQMLLHSFFWPPSSDPKASEAKLITLIARWYALFTVKTPLDLRLHVISSSNSNWLRGIDRISSTSPWWKGFLIRASLIPFPFSFHEISNSPPFGGLSGFGKGFWALVLLSKGLDWWKSFPHSQSTIYTPPWIVPTPNNTLNEMENL